MTPSKHQFDGKKVKVKLADVCTLTMGQSPSSNSYNEIGNGIPFFQGNADFGEEAPVPRVWCTDPKKTAEGGDLLISVRAPIGAVNMAVERCCIGRGVAAIHPNDDSISVDFLKHQLLSKRRELETMGTGSTFKAVGKKSLGNLTLVLYPEDTQHEIERCLNQIKKQIKAISSQSSKLDSLVKSRFVEMFGDLKSDTNGWPIKPFETFAIIDTHMANDLTPYLDMPHIGIDSIESGTGRLSGYRTVAEDGIISGKYPFTPEHLIYSKIRPSLNKVALPDFSGVCSSDAYPILPIAGECNRVYLAEVMRSAYFLEYILPLSGRAQMPKVNKKALSGFSMPLPPIELQQQFAAFVAQVDKSRFAMLSGALKTLYARLMESLA